MDKVRIGVIGLGGRGFGLMKAVMLPREYVEVAAVCDLYEDRCKRAADKVKEERGTEPYCTNDYKKILADKDIDAVIISTSWTDHIKIAVDSMKAGKYTACEVGGAYSVDDCWKLVHTYEETGVPCMLLENCCYGRDELMVLNMVKQEMCIRDRLSTEKTGI